MLSDIRRTYAAEAKKLRDFTHKSIDELANGYCDALDNHDEVNMNRYFSALMIRFWNSVEKMYQMCWNAPGIERDDCASRIAECINIACEYRGWRDSAKKINAQQCINQVISTRGGKAVIYNTNLDKNKADVGAVSLDAPFSDTDDAELTLMDTLEEEENIIDISDATTVAQSFVQKYINKNKLVEAIILDTIAFNDVEKTNKVVNTQISETGEKTKWISYTKEFWEHKCIQALNTLPDNYSDYFATTYKVNSDALDAALTAVKEANNQKLYRYLRATLKKCREELVR